MRLIPMEGFVEDRDYVQVAVLSNVPTGPEIWSPATEVGVYQDSDGVVWIVKHGEVCILDTSEPEPADVDVEVD